MPKLGMDKKWRETLRCYFDSCKDWIKRVVVLYSHDNKKQKKSSDLRKILIP